MAPREALACIAAGVIVGIVLILLIVVFATADAGHDKNGRPW